MSDYQDGFEAGESQAEHQFHGQKLEMRRLPEQMLDSPDVFVGLKNLIQDFLKRL